MLHKIIEYRGTVYCRAVGRSFGSSWDRSQRPAIVTEFFHDLHQAKDRIVPSNQALADFHSISSSLLYLDLNQRCLQAKNKSQIKFKTMFYRHVSRIAFRSKIKILDLYF